MKAVWDSYVPDRLLNCLFKMLQPIHNSNIEKINRNAEKKLAAFFYAGLADLGLHTVPELSSFSSLVLGFF